MVCQCVVAMYLVAWLAAWWPAWSPKYGQKEAVRYVITWLINHSSYGAIRTHQFRLTKVKLKWNNLVPYSDVRGRAHFGNLFVQGNSMGWTLGRAPTPGRAPSSPPFDFYSTIDNLGRPTIPTYLPNLPAMVLLDRLKDRSTKWPHYLNIIVIRQQERVKY
jgi:hypothetical protein